MEITSNSVDIIYKEARIRLCLENKIIDRITLYDGSYINVDENADVTIDSGLITIIDKEDQEITFIKVEDVLSIVWNEMCDDDEDDISCL